MLHDRTEFHRTLSRLPNALTWGRLLAALPLAALCFWPAAGAPLAAFWLFCIAAATDFLDGWLARQLGATSEFGARLDPIADKVLVATALVALTVTGTIAGAHVAAAAVILLREGFVQTLRVRRPSTESKAALRGLPLARWKTFAQMGAIAALLYARTAEGDALILGLGLGLLWVAAALSLYTAWIYVGGSRSAGGDAPEGPEPGGNSEDRHEGVVLRLDQARDRLRRRDD